MRIRVISDRITDTYDGVVVDAEWAKEYVAGCTNLIVPGVLSWDSVQTEWEGDNNIVISADLATEDVVSEAGNYTGDEVSEDFVRQYILGADIYWLAPGVLKATAITFS